MFVSKAELFTKLRNKLSSVDPEGERAQVLLDEALEILLQLEEKCL